MISVAEYLTQATIMQLATVANAKPWVCSVYFVADAENNLYWLSFPERRHSMELAANTYAAVTMAIKTDKPVVGMSAEGIVSIVEDSSVVEAVMRRYIDKYDDGKKFYENFTAKTNRHVMYKLTVSKFTLFDELNFAPSEARQEIIVENN